jgi:hypothetical protein
VWSVGRGHDPDWGGTDHHEAADACTGHGVRDGGCGARSDPGLGCPVGANRGDHRVDVVQRGREYFEVWSGQVLPYDVDARRQLRRVPHHSSDRVTGSKGLAEDLAADATGGAEQGEFHAAICRNDSAWSAAQVAKSVAGRPRISATVWVTGAGRSTASACSSR